MNSKALFYSSAVSLGILLFLVMFIGNRSSKNNKKQEPNTYLLTDEKNALMEGEKAFERQFTNFTSNLNGNHNFTLLTKFAFIDGLNDFNEMVFEMEDDRYYLSIKNHKETKLYSRGTFYVKGDSDTAEYIFTSKIMPANEAYYRFKNLEIAGSFYKDIGVVPIKSWIAVKRNQDIYEVWTLKKEKGVWKELGTGLAFEKND